MEYEFKKNQKPFFLTLDWTKGELWDSIEFPIDEVKDIIPLIVKYAMAQGVKLEYVKKDDLVEFIIIKKDEDEFQRCKNKIVQFLNEIGGEGTTMDLNKRMKNYKHIYKIAIESLIEERKIEKYVKEGYSMGRPTTAYRLI